MKFLINPGIILMLLVAVAQSVMSAIVKGIALHISIGIQVLAYYAIPLIFLILIAIRKRKINYKTNLLGFYFLRGFFAAASVFCFFYASRNTQLGVAAVLFNATPVFIPLFAWMFLKEKSSKQVLIGIVLSLIGVIIVIHPQAGQFLTPVSLIGIASGIFMALAQVMLRHLAKIKESTDKIVFHLYVSCTVISLAFILFEKFFVGHNIVKVHSGGHAMFVIIMLITLGCISLIAQRILTKAFSHMPAAKLAPFLYVSIPISSIIGWAFWSQQLDINFYLGGVMILIGILFITLDSKKEKICTLHKQQHKHSLKGVN